MRNEYLFFGLLICGVMTNLLMTTYDTLLLSTIKAQQTTLKERKIWMPGEKCWYESQGRPAVPLSQVCSMLSPEFGRLVNVKAKIVSANNKCGDVLLDVYECNGTPMQYGCILKVDKLSMDKGGLCHIGEICEISGYESIMIEGTPREILARKGIQDKEYNIANSFVILEIVRHQGDLR